MNYEEYKKEIEKRGTLTALGGNGGHIEQNAHELALFSVWLKENNVKKILELGISYGSLHRYFREVLEIDAWGIDINTEAPDADNMEPCQVLHKDIHSEEAQEWAHIHHPYDLILFDESHDLNSLVKDDKLYSNMSAKYLVWHDACGGRNCLPVPFFIMTVYGEDSIKFFVANNIETASGIAIIEK